MVTIDADGDAQWLEVLPLEDPEPEEDADPAMIDLLIGIDDPA